MSTRSPSRSTNGVDIATRSAGTHYAVNATKEGPETITLDDGRVVTVEYPEEGPDGDDSDASDDSDADEESALEAFMRLRQSDGTPAPPALSDAETPEAPTVPELPPCTDCKSPPCRAYAPDVPESDFISEAEACCQATRWKYGNTAAFPHVCGHCAKSVESSGDDEAASSRMTYRKAEEYCMSLGGGLCQNNQVTVAQRSPTCGVGEAEKVWTSATCGEEGTGRFSMRAGGGGRTCEEDLGVELEALCCANTCNTFKPDHMCDAPNGEEFWQATLGMKKAGRGRERRVLPEAPKKKAEKRS